MPRRLRKKSNRPRRRAARPRRGRKSSMPNTATAGKGQYAKIIETLEFADLQPNITMNNAFTLSQFPRAATLAGNFAFYKAAKVVWNYEPLYNTFQDTTGSSSAPYLYTVMNRGQISISPIPTLGNILATGARPKKLVGKTTISYKPNWCSPGMSSILLNGSGGNPVALFQQGVKQQYGWLASSGTEVRSLQGSGAPGGVPALAYVQQGIIQPNDFTPNPPGTFLDPINITNSVVYNGHLQHIDQQIDNNSAPVCRLTATVEWHFKGALFNQPLLAAQPP